MTRSGPMFLTRASLLGLFACALLWSNGAGVSAKAISSMQRSQLPFGSTLIVRRDDSVASVAIELWFRAPSIGYDNPPVEGLAMYAANAIAASKTTDGFSVSDTIKSVGGRFAITTYPDAVSIAAAVPAGGRDEQDAAERERGEEDADDDEETPTSWPRSGLCCDCQVKTTSRSGSEVRTL